MKRRLSTKVASDPQTPDCKSAPKAKRSSRACIWCRSIKRKCNGLEPCITCANDKRECEYAPQKKRGRKPPKDLQTGALGKTVENDIQKDRRAKCETFESSVEPSKPFTDNQFKNASKISRASAFPVKTNRNFESQAAQDKPVKAQHYQDHQFSSLSSDEDSQENRRILKLDALGQPEIEFRFHHLQWTIVPITDEYPTEQRITFLGEVLEKYKQSIGMQTNVDAFSNLVEEN